MDCIVVRTVFQAALIKEVLDHDLAPRKYFLIEIYSSDSELSAAESCHTRISIRDDSSVTVKLSSENPVFVWLFWLLLFSLCARLSRGRLLAACIDSYPIALSALLCPGLRVETFDDGEANYIVNTPKEYAYYYSTPNILYGYSLPRRLIRRLFPAGSSSWFLRRSKRHYAAYSLESHIFPKHKLVPVKINWGKYLVASDLSALVLDRKYSIMLGTAYQDFEYMPDVAARILSNRSAFLPSCDFYVPHPREIVDKRLVDMNLILEISSPVEPLIGYLAAKGCLQSVYHFGSTAGRFAEQIEGLRVIDILP